jgi:hypothetical protein
MKMLSDRRRGEREKRVGNSGKGQGLNETQFPWGEVDEKNISDADYEEIDNNASD